MTALRTTLILTLNTIVFLALIVPVGCACLAGHAFARVPNDGWRRGS